MKIRIILSAFILSAMLVNGQSKSEVSNKEIPLTWLGVDFSEAKLIGDRERLGSESDIHKLMNAINELMVVESEKYAVHKSTGRTKEKVTTDISVASNHNDELEANRLISDQQTDITRLKKSDVERIVSGYDFKSHKGLGVIFIVEAFSKFDEKAAIWVTFVDLDSKEVLLTERREGKPKGFGLRNYWSGAIYGIMEAMKKDWAKMTR